MPEMEEVAVRWAWIDIHSRAAEPAALLFGILPADVSDFAAVGAPLRGAQRFGWAERGGGSCGSSRVCRVVDAIRAVVLIPVIRLSEQPEVILRYPIRNWLHYRCFDNPQASARRGRIQLCCQPAESEALSRVRCRSWSPHPWLAACSLRSARYDRAPTTPIWSRPMRPWTTAGG